MISLSVMSMESLSGFLSCRFIQSFTNLFFLFILYKAQGQLKVEGCVRRQFVRTGVEDDLFKARVNRLVSVLLSSDSQEEWGWCTTMLVWWWCILAVKVESAGPKNVVRARIFRGSRSRTARSLSHPACERERGWRVDNNSSPAMDLRRFWNKAREWGLGSSLPIETWRKRKAYLMSLSI